MLDCILINGRQISYKLIQALARYDLTEFEWKMVEPLLPNKPRAVPRVDDRRARNDIFWICGTARPRPILPERYQQAMHPKPRLQ